ncbi:MAG TPA: LarC family nickel insertion protein [Armatimonadota bacterium]|nr:LarC family nickel insertion protein [Armatimonadota bacterium]
MRIAYLDITCGIAGDMFLAALLDAGCDRAALEDQLRRLPIADEFELEVNRVRRGALMGAHLEVKTGPPAPHAHGRSYSEIVQMIRGANLTPRVQRSAVEVFTAIGEVEAYLHGSTIEEIHFHEVGAVDSIVDIVGACAAIELLGIEAIYSSAITDGSGILECAHGVMPVPAPATLELLKGAPLVSCDIPYELVTPTGAALLRQFCKGYGPRPGMIVEAVGYGAGTREIAERPNLLRVSIGESFLSGPERVIAHVHTHDLGHAHDHDHVHSHSVPHSHDHDHDRTPEHDHAHPDHDQIHDREG